MLKKWVCHYFTENDTCYHSKNIECILMYIEIHGGEHYVYLFHIIVLCYFLIKMSNISGFVKMLDFDQNYKFPRNVWSPLSEN